MEVNNANNGIVLIVPLTYIAYRIPCKLLDGSYAWQPFVLLPNTATQRLNKAEKNSKIFTR